MDILKALPQFVAASSAIKALDHDTACLQAYTLTNAIRGFFAIQECSPMDEVDS
jgi:hypothetical protein